MSTDVVLDSTAIASIFFKDKYSERVEAAVKKFGRLYTMDIALAEVGSVAWKRIHIFKEDFATDSRALASAMDFIQYVCQVFESWDVLIEALELGVRQGLTIYDCLFMALGRRMKLKLLTTDEKLRNRTQESKELRDLTLLP